MLATDGTDGLVDNNNNSETNTDLNVVFLAESARTQVHGLLSFHPCIFGDVYLGSESPNSGAVTDIFSLVMYILELVRSAAQHRCNA